MPDEDPDGPVDDPWLAEPVPPVDNAAAVRIALVCLVAGPLSADMDYFIHSAAASRDKGAIAASPRCATTSQAWSSS